MHFRYYLRPRELGAAKLIDRWNVNWLYALAFFLWSGATGATGFANVFWQFLILRLLLGMSESLAYPAYAKMMVVSFPEKLRGTANGLIDAGSKLGPTVGAFVGMEILARYDWRGMFIIIGAASMLWLVPWCSVAGKLPHKILIAQSMRSEGHELQNAHGIARLSGYCRWFVRWELCLVFHAELAASVSRKGTALFRRPPAKCDYLLRRRCSGFGQFRFSGRLYYSSRARCRQSAPAFHVLGLLLCCPLMFAAVRAPMNNEQHHSSHSHVHHHGWLVIESLGLSQTLAGPVRLVNGRAPKLHRNFAGIFAPWISGYALDKTHSFFAAFAIASFFLLVAVISYWFAGGQTEAKCFISKKQFRTLFFWPLAKCEKPAGGAGNFSVGDAGVFREFTYFRGTKRGANGNHSIMHGDRLPRKKGVYGKKK